MVASRLLARLTHPVAATMSPPEMAFDFRQPAGEAALIGPDSVSWRIFKNPVTLFIGGVAAVLLELAEPSVRSGVWDHSGFRRDAMTRLRRTDAAAMMTVYGPAEEARRMIAHVVRMHDRVTGTTPDGQAYRANDPRLLDWVQATAAFGFIEAYSRFARGLTPAEKDRAFAEGAVSARLYGATGAPSSAAEWEAMLARTLPGLERSAIVFEFLEIMQRAPLMPWVLRPFQRLLVRAAVTLVPLPARQRLGLGDLVLSGAGLAVAQVAGRLADRIPVPDAPPAQASIRIGRDPAFLYR